MKRPLIVFAIFAAVFGVGIPYLAIKNDGSKNQSVAEVPAKLRDGQELFQTHCGACHTLKKGGTDGIVGPNLDELLGTSAPDARTTRVANAIKNGGTGIGKMPAGILVGKDRQVVADFVAQAAKTSGAAPATP